MVKYEDILDARDNLHEDIIRTPLQNWRHGATMTGKTVHLKLESMQRTGSFKPRGAWNKLRLLRPAERKAGVVCASAGNHAQGVAFAANIFGVRATIVMPEHTPEIKITQTRLYGDPEIILCGESLSQAMDKAFEIQKERGSIFVHAYDDDAVIAGQGTIGLELLEQWPDMDTIIVPVGGGGLIAGIAVATMSHNHDIRVVGVQAKGADAVARSMESGRPESLESSHTIADGINVRRAGARTVEILRKFEIPVIRVSDEEIRAAITALFQTAKLIAEPAGAASVAALLFRKEILAEGRNAVAVISGANINMCCYAEIIRSIPGIPPEELGFKTLTCRGGKSCPTGSKINLITNLEAGLK